MEVVALVAALLALAVALAALSRAGSLGSDVEEARRDAGRRVGNLEEELRGELATLREHVAQVAEGGRPEREMILEGRTWGDVDAAEGRRLVEAGEVRVLDVRTPAETDGGVIPGALLVPVDELMQRADELPRDGKPLLVACAMGGRSAAACEMLAAQGWSGLRNLAGGMSSWTGAVEKPSA